MRHRVCALLLAALLPSAFSDEITSVTTPQERGHVVVHKRLQEAVLVQHQPFTVVYDVMNIGTECVLGPLPPSAARTFARPAPTAACPAAGPQLTSPSPSPSLPPRRRPLCPPQQQRCVQRGGDGRLPRAQL
jgi:hypothetical protein